MYSEAAFLLIPDGLQTQAKAPKDTCVGSMVGSVFSSRPRVCCITDTKMTCSEEKLNEIAEKVDRIYLAVDNGGTAHSSSSQPTFIIPQPCPYTPASTGSVAQYASDSAGSDLEGELSLNAHAAYATDYVQQAMGSNAHVSGGMMSSLHTLRQAIEGSSKENLPKGNSLPAEPVKFSTGDSCISLPDMPYAMSCLQRLRESERLWYCWSWEIESVGEFIEYLLPVYSGQPSLAEVIIVNDGLCRLFTECSRDEGNINVSREMLAQAETCHKNLKNAIRRLPFLIPSTFDYALALFLAVCRPYTFLPYLLAVKTADIIYLTKVHASPPKLPDSTSLEMHIRSLPDMLHTWIQP